MQTAEQLFNDNVRYNQMLCKYKTTKKVRVGACKMTPDQVIRELKKRDADITRRTLFNWEEAELIPKAKRGSYGQGGGKWADYPDETVSEALTAYLLKNVYRLKNAEIAEARKGYKEGNKRFFTDTYIYYLNHIKKGQDFASILHNAEGEKEGFTNAEHTLEFFRKHGKKITSLEDLEKILDNTNRT